MSESFRPHESSSIDEDLRIRLEGTIELLEDALPLLDSLMYLLARVESSPDDVATLKECVNQLPRIDEAIDRANKYEQAVELTQAVGQRKKTAHYAANDRLRSLGHGEAPSLRAAAIAVLDLVSRQGTAPRPGEVPLLESAGPPWVGALFFGAMNAAVVSWGYSPKFGAVYGALTCILMLYARAPTRWMLFADRLYFPTAWPKLGREILPSAIQGLSIQESKVHVQLQGDTVKVQTDSPAKLVSLLRMLKTPWLQGLKSPPGWSLIVDAINQETKVGGRALVSNEGVLFVPAMRAEAAVKAVCSEELTGPMSLDEVLKLIAHLPGGRWAALAEHLAQKAEVVWLPRAELRVEDSVVRSGEKRVRLIWSGSTAEEGLRRLAPP